MQAGSKRDTATKTVIRSVLLYTLSFLTCWTFIFQRHSKNYFAIKIAQGYHETSIVGERETDTYYFKCPDPIFDNWANLQNFDIFRLKITNEMFYPCNYVAIWYVNKRTWYNFRWT